MIIFQANVSVPSHVVKQIGMEVKMLAMRELEARNFSNDDLQLIDHVIENSAFAVAAKSEKSCEGWSLEKHQAEDIAHELRNGRRIAAIKTFREATGGGLRASKMFIDKFECNEMGAIDFLVTFI